MRFGRKSGRANQARRHGRDLIKRSIASFELLEERRLLSGSSFAPAVTTALQIGSAATFTLQGDLNNDGIPDIIAQHSNSLAQVFLGTSSGSFTAGSFVTTGGQPLALGDFNGDGTLDLATQSGILLGTGSGTFATSPVSTPALPASTNNLFTADFNGDGKLDLAAATYTTASNGSATVGLTIFMGNGNGTFGSPTSTTIGSAAGITSRYATFITGDFNGDGVLDVATPFGVSPGLGTGTFSALLPYPTSSTPTTPLIVSGDFNGDGILDMAVLPSGSTSGSSAGQVEALLGTGHGTFTDAGPVSVGNATVSALATGDINGDGKDDLLIGVSASGAPSVATLISNGDGTFAAGTFYSVSGTPISISTGDFNADSSLDILSANAANGAVPTSSVALPIVAASTLLNQTPAPAAPTIGLVSSANPVVTGVPLQLKATVAAPVVTGATQVTPTGTVTFFSGTTSLGSAALVSGIARFTTSTLPLGRNSITAVYSGDANYASITSAVLTQTVLQTAAKVPLLIPSIAAASLPTPFIKGDKGSITVAITDVGGGSANGSVAVKLFASLDGAVDSSAIAIATPSSFNKVSISVGSGGSRVITGKFTAGAYPSGAYSILAVLSPVSKFTADQVSSSPAASPTTFTAAGNVFGTIGKHKNIKFGATDQSGNVGVFSLTGPGSGTVTVTNGVVDVVTTGTTSASKLSIASTSGTFDYHNIVVNGALNTFDAHSSAVDGAVTVTGNVSTVKVGSTAAATTSFTVAGRTPLKLSAGNVPGLSFNTAGQITTLSAASWTGGAISASAINTMTVSGNISADVFTHEGGKITKATLGALGGSVWAIAGGIGTLKINNAVTNARVLAGVDAGADNAFGTSDDIYAAATITTLLINGADTSSVIAAGVGPASGGTVLDGLVLLPKGAIKSITVNGTFANDSKIVASSLPTTATITGAKIATSGDPRFSV